MPTPHPSAFHPPTPARLAALVAAGLLTAVTLAACTPDEGTPGQPGTPPAQAEARPVITEAEAQAVLDEMNQKANQANAAYDSELLGQISGESDFEQTEAVYRIGRVLDPEHRDPIPEYTYGDPRFHIPTSSAFPQWFVADTSVSLSETSRYLLVFSREAEGQPWRLVNGGRIGGTVPELATDPGGNAVAVAPDDGQAMAGSPAEIAERHSAWLTGGAGAPEAAQFELDERSSGILDDGELREQLVFVDGAGQITPAESFTNRVTVEPYPVRALRTKDGGALAFYVTKREVVAEQPGGTIALTGGDEALAGKDIFRDRLTVTWLTGWATHVPREGGKAAVVASSMGKTGVA